ncbi:MAG: N-acetylmuramoyl-L-alanine amidase [Clostridia bacterium]
MNIQENLLSISRMSRPSTRTNTIKKIVIHYVGNPNTTAIANRNYFERLKSQSTTYASSHYIIGLEGEIIRCIPENEVAYHSGESNMNLTSIGIENCHPTADGKFNDLTFNSLILLLTDICKRYNLNPMTDIIRHYDVSGKRCPLYYVNNPEEFNNIKLKVNSLINNISDIQINYEKYRVTPVIGLNVRISPDVNSTKVTAYKYNEIIDISEVINNFGKTKDGYVSMDYVEKISNNTKYRVTPIIGLNVRIGPSVNTKKVTAYKYNEIIDISEVVNNFGKTKDGYVSMDYVKKI